MKPDDAKKNLTELRDSLNEVLGGEVPQDKKEKSLEFRDSAKEDKGSFFEKLINKAQKLPVVDTFSQLGVAGSVAVSSAFVTQTDLAKDTTEVFVAEIANDVVEQKITPPDFVDSFVDFNDLNDWGEVVIAERFVEAQNYLGEVSEQIQTKIETGEIQVSKPKTSVASASSSSSQNNKQLQSSQETEEKEESEKPIQEKQVVPEKESGKEEAKIEEEQKEKSDSLKEDKEEEPKEVKKEDTQNKEKPVEEEKTIKESHKKESEVKESKEEEPPSEDDSEQKIDEIPKVESEDFDLIKPHHQVSSPSR